MTPWGLRPHVFIHFLDSDGRNRRNAAFLFMPLFQSACEWASAASRESAAFLCDWLRSQQIARGLIGVFGEVTHRRMENSALKTTKILIWRETHLCPNWQCYELCRSINNSRVHPQGVKTQGGVLFCRCFSALKKSETQGCFNEVKHIEWLTYMRAQREQQRSIGDWKRRAVCG